MDAMERMSADRQSNQTAERWDCHQVGDELHWLAGATSRKAWRALTQPNLHSISPFPLFPPDSTLMAYPLLGGQVEMITGRMLWFTLVLIGLAVIGISAFVIFLSTPAR